MATATAPSILPTDLCLASLMLPAAAGSTRMLAMFQRRIGSLPVFNCRPRIALSIYLQSADMLAKPWPN